MGDDPSYEAFFAEQYASIVRALIPIVGDQSEAESISQDAFVKALNRWRRLSRYDSPGAWVRRVAIRDAVRSAVRSSRQRPFVDSDAGQTSDDLRFLESDAALDEALAALPPRQRACVVLRHVDGWSTEEIADALDCSTSTVRVHIHRGLQSMSDCLEDPQTEETADAS